MLLVVVVRSAHAEPLRLRADAVAEAKPPAGLVVLQGEDRTRPVIGAEGLVWAGAKRDDDRADVLVLALRLREPHGFGEARAGRFVFATGAIRPLHVDGASVLGRAPTGSTIELVGGQPVVPDFGPRAYDWVAGGRIAQSYSGIATTGVSYVQRRAHGEIADQEMGADVSAAPSRTIDLAARSAYDITSPGIAEALASAAMRVDPVRVELFATHRSPSRLVPATSLFSVLGDFPSERAGASARWEAAPRLDVFGSGAVRAVGGEVGSEESLRALLRLDDRGDGSAGVEARRQDVPSARWTGLRTTLTQPLDRLVRFRATAEIEIAIPDEPRGRGAVWPWALAALAWRSGTGWEAAAAVEAAATPQHSFETNALVRLSRTFEGR
jgi:hypothetical protein